MNIHTHYRAITDLNTLLKNIPIISQIYLYAVRFFQIILKFTKVVFSKSRISGSGSLLVLLGDLAELRVDNIVVALGLGAGVGRIGVGAGQTVLAEHGLVAAEEGVVHGLGGLASLLISEGHAHVEHAALAGDVGVVAVGAPLAAEVLHGFGPQHLQVAVGELEGLARGGGDQGGGGDDEEQLHGGGWACWMVSLHGILSTTDDAILRRRRPGR